MITYTVAPSMDPLGAARAPTGKPQCAPLPRNENAAAAETTVNPSPALLAAEKSRLLAHPGGSSLAFWRGR